MSHCICRRLVTVASHRVSGAVLALALGGAAGTARALTISEVMYDPGPDGVKFVEIYNEDGEARDLSHFRFSSGIEFQFPGRDDGSPVFIRGKSYLVVAKDPQALLARNPYLDNSRRLFPAVVGPFFGDLSPTGADLILVNAGGALEVEVKFKDRSPWPAAASGTGHSMTLRDPDLDDPSDPANWTWSPLRGGTPGLANSGDQVFASTTLIAAGDSWRFFRGKEAPSDPADGWRASAFDDGAWDEAPAPIGYGDPCYTGKVLDDMRGSYLSVYFRRSFQVPDPAAVDVLLFRLSADDGFIAYLNGVEVNRHNMASGDSTFEAAATGTGKCSTKLEVNVPDPASKLVAGTNVLAIEVHNRTLGDSSFGLAPELVAKKASRVGAADRVDLVLNEVLWNTAQPGTGWIELYNPDGEARSLEGYSLSDDPSKLERFALPASSTVPPHGFLVVEEADLAQAGVQLASLSGKDLFVGLTRRLADQPAGQDLQVVDAARFRLSGAATTVGMSSERFPDGADRWVIGRVPSKGGPNSFQAVRDVVLNEVMYHPYYPFANEFVAGTNGFRKPEDQAEYIEVFNRGAAAVDLSGWGIAVGVQYSFPEGASIGPGAYLVVARDPDYIRGLYGLPAAQVVGPWHGNTDAIPAALSDRTETIELQDEIGNAVDSVRYSDRGRFPKWADGLGSSLEKIDPFADGSLPGNWDASDESTKADWVHYSWKGKYTEAEKDFVIILLTRGIVLLDNVSVTDPANPAAGNYIKNGDFEKPLSSPWILDGTHIHSGRITYDKKDGDACLKVMSTGRGNNRIDCIRYTNPTFPTNKELLLEFDAKWITGLGTLQFSGTWNTFAHSFRLDRPKLLGTPGAENSVRHRFADSGAGPLVDHVRQQPVLPGAQQPVTVTALVSDPDGVKEVNLVWRLDSVHATPQSIPMLDDGQPPDERAGDGIYSAVIPGQALGKRILFDIEASDSIGNVGRFPFDDRIRTHPILLDPATTDETGLHHAAYIHGVLGAQGGVPDYRMVLSQEDTQYLMGRHVMNNDIVDSSLIWNDRRVFYNIGMRFGNSPWTRTASVQTSYKIKLSREEELQRNRKFKLYNGGNQVNERAEYYLLQGNNEPGRTLSPYGRGTYCRPFLNTLASGIVFEREDVPDKDYIRRWFYDDDQGVLYKLDDKFLVSLPDGKRRDNRDAFVRYNGDDPEGYRWWFLHRTRDKFDDFSQLIDLAKFFTTAGGDTYASNIASKVNLEEMVRTLAVEINCDDWDTWGTTRGKNSYIYHAPIDGRWYLIPWDKNLTFGNPSNLSMTPPMFAEVVKMLSSPPGKRMYDSALNDMLKGNYTTDYLNTFFNEQAKDRDGKPILGLPPTAGGPASFISTRTSMIRAFLPKGAARFELITGGAAGAVASSAPSLVVEGNAPLELYQIVVASDAPNWLDPTGKVSQVILDVNHGDLAWTTPTKWRTVTPLPLLQGLQRLTFAGFDAAGVSIGSATLLAGFNLGWDPPRADSASPSVGPKSGGTQVVIHGAGLHPGLAVLFGKTAATAVTVSQAGDSATATTPAGVAGPVDVQVTNIDGQSATLTGGFTYASGGFNRGDVDGNGKVDITDVVAILSYAFQGGATPPCLESADVDDDGQITVNDPVSLLGYLFQGGPAPPPPFDASGATLGSDPTPDSLGCAGGA